MSELYVHYKYFNFITIQVVAVSNHNRIDSDSVFNYYT